MGHLTTSALKSAFQSTIIVLYAAHDGNIKTKIDFLHHVTLIDNDRKMKKEIYKPGWSDGIPEHRTRVIQR